MAEEAGRLLALRERLHAAIASRVPGIRLNGHPTDRLPGNLNLSFADVDGEALMMAMRDVAVSSGSACSAADPEPSHVLRAMGLGEDLARSSLRFGLGRFTHRGRGRLRRRGRRLGRRTAPQPGRCLESGVTCHLTMRYD